MTVEGIEKAAEAVRLLAQEVKTFPRSLQEEALRLASSIDAIVEQARISYNLGLFHGLLIGVVAILALKYIRSGSLS